MAIEQVIHMNGGEGETSYATNSSFQRKVILKVKLALEDSITRLYGTTLPECLKVADLGCSSGPNALLVTSSIIEIVDAASKTLNRQPPMFQFFLSDLFGNDFNTLFKSLPEFYKRLQEEKGPNFGPCFITGMPGTIYGRLFPNNSIHFFHSSYCLNFLAKTPKELTNEAEPINKGTIYISNQSPPVVHKAYLEQYKQDFKLFLRSRSEELLPGGGMVLTFIGTEKDHLLTHAWVVMGMVLNDMVSENLVEKKKLDSYNAPYYCPTAEEVREVVKAEGSFNLESLEIFTMDWVNQSDNGSSIDEDLQVEAATKGIRAVFESLLKEEFGEEIMDELFSRLKNKIVEIIRVEKLDVPSLRIYLTKST